MGGHLTAFCPHEAEAEPASARTFLRANWRENRWTNPEQASPASPG